MRSYPALLLTLVLTAAACSGGNSPSGPGSTSVSVTGHWQFKDPNVTGFPYWVDLQLTEGSGGALTGTGRIEDEGYSDVAVSGKHDGSTVTLSISGSACKSASFVGSLSDKNTISGTTVYIQGYGCREGAWTLKRQ